VIQALHACYHSCVGRRCCLFEDVRKHQIVPERAAAYKCISPIIHRMKWALVISWKVYISQKNLAEIHPRFARMIQMGIEFSETSIIKCLVQWKCTYTAQLIKHINRNSFVLVLQPTYHLSIFAVMPVHSFSCSVFWS